MIILRDITELIKAEYVRSMEKLSDSMIASTSHDMRTPLNTIINMQSLIEPRVADPLLQKWIRTAKISANLLLFLVNDTLDYYQIKAGKFTQKRSSFSIRDAVEGCFDLISLQLE